MVDHYESLVMREAEDGGLGSSWKVVSGAQGKDKVLISNGGWVVVVVVLKDTMVVGGAIQW